MPEQTHPRGPALALDGLAKAYPGGAAVAQATLDVAAGSFVALVGPSGSGKSTLLKMINRLVEPSAGSVTIGGARAESLPPHLLRRRIGYVFQDVGLFRHMTVGENIAIGPRIAGAPPAPARTAELLEMVALPPAMAGRMPASLSGGQRQRVGVARALATEPGLMLMDEPFGALDPVTRDALGTAYRALHERLGLTTILVTHDMAEALLLADRVLVMAAGRIVADATPAALLAGEGGPEAQALVAVPRAQARRMTELGRGA